MLFFFCFLKLSSIFCNRVSSFCPSWLKHDAMADPLSVAASIIAVISAADGVAKTFFYLRKWRNAPNEALVLNNEVSDLRLILGHLERCYVQGLNRPPISQDHEGMLVTLIQHTRDQILKLDKLLQRLVVKGEPTGTNVQISRLGWIKAESTIRHFCQRLRDVRLRIITHLMVLDS